MSIFLFVVGVNLDPGDHAFLSYGPISNDDLLQYYGFVERDNPSDTYVLNGMGESLRQVSGVFPSPMYASLELLTLDIKIFLLASFLSQAFILQMRLSITMYYFSALRPLLSDHVFLNHAHLTGRRVDIPPHQHTSDFSRCQSCRRQLSQMCMPIYWCLHSPAYESLDTT